MRIKSGFLLLVLGMPLLTETAPCAQTVTVFGNLVPNTPVDPDASAVTLGMKFWSTQSGTVSGIRFYRGAKNSNGYTVKLFTAGGSLLASARASTDTCAVPLGTGEFRFAGVARRQHRYIAAYYTSNGRYAGDNYGMTNGKTNGSLTAPASSAVCGNGVYTYSTGFPNQTWYASNYYVDVSFAPTGVPPYLTLSFTPPNPRISATAPAGTVVTTITAAWRDGSPFTGTLGFATPYSTDHGVVAISGNELIISSTGPGVSADSGTLQNATITATQ